MLIESGAQGGTTALTHFDFAAPLATLAHPRVHAGIGQDDMKETSAFKAARITEFSGDQRAR
jgi:hypothetical protein